ncbi:MAG: sulfite exporter TauE/SafE family protein [Sulfurimonas sp.]|nr:sulfite exporter TauE/SafE family protein [Sulfurimonas sp.]MDD3059594.1 sulfite exporter TauE/SafE family protein [Sulfurimonas sp.]MDD5202756.1 sulfite exporter TauE/SafE family protein [Sulfurimonas sp.]
MELYIIAFAAFVASLLTFFSGFGLGTLLMPIVAIFFPPAIAIAITAVVHFANNILKFFLVAKNADAKVLLYFGVPAVIFAFLGAYLLGFLSAIEVLYEYMLFDKSFVVTPIKFVIGVLILFFVLIELLPYFSKMSVNKKWLPLGGILSGFFGGLSGNQGAFRSMFLLKAGLNKESFIATGVVLAVMVDSARMFIYKESFLQSSDIEWQMVVVATIAAFLGTIVGNKLLKKVSIEFIRALVSILLTIISLSLVSGVI